MSRSAVALAHIVAPCGAPASDTHLLRTFITAQTDDAFAELVRRHGPMVLAVCRRVLSDDHDAEDAFQAVFLVLARKAATLQGQNVAGWLYGVAVRTARGVRVMRDRRRKHERASCGRQPAGPALTVDLDTAQIIDEELAKLPDHLRDAVVLCELRGLSRQRAAAELGVPEGTLSSRLAAAKRKLAARLAARGLASAALTAVLGHATVSAALLESTVVAVRGAAGSVAACAASAVVKGMLFDQLRAAVLTTALCLTVVCGGLAMTGAAPDAPPERAAAPAPHAAEDPAALVKQLGSAVFAEREAAAKALRKLGTKAEPVLRAGLRSDDPEIRARSAEVLKQNRKAAMEAFLAGKAEPDGPAWKRFKELLGDTNASRKLYAEMMADDRRAATVEQAEANPDRAAEIYAAEVTRMTEVSRKALAHFIGQPAPVLQPGEVHPIAVESRKAVVLGDVVAILFLGSHQLPKGAKDPSTTHVFEASFADGAVGPLKEPLRKLFAAWIAQRRDPATVRDALETGLFAGLPEVLPLARKLADDAKTPAGTKGLALLALGNHGNLDDLPRLTEHATDTRAYRAYTSTDNKRRETQIREIATAMSLHLRGQDFEKYGFGRSNWQCWWLPTNPAPLKDIHLFENDKARDASLKKAWEWLDKQPKEQPKPPAKGAKVWPHFAKVVGADEDSRALFDLIVSNPKALELLERARSGERDVLKQYRTRRDELNVLWRTCNEEALRHAAAPPAPRQGIPLPNEKPADPPGGVPVVETAGWLLLGTYPATQGDEDGPRLDFLDLTLGQRHLTEALDKGPMAKPLRKLVGVWLANRGDEPRAVLVGFSLAQQFDVPSTLPVARRWLEKYDGAKATWERTIICAQAIQIVGKYGTKDDVPLLARFASDATVVTHIVPDKGAVKPGTVAPVDGRDSTEEVRDAALAMMVALHGGEPCPMRFRSQAEREAAHKKARASLAEQKK